MSSEYSELGISQRFSAQGLAGFIQESYMQHELEGKINSALKCL